MCEDIWYGGKPCKQYITQQEHQDQSDNAVEVHHERIESAVQRSAHQPRPCGAGTDRSEKQSPKIPCCLSRAILASFTVPSLPSGGAGGSMLPRRSRPRQAHASCRSPERRYPPRAVLTRRGGSGYP